MMKTLLEIFIAEEASPYVCELIFDAVTQYKEQSEEAQTRFEFNCFDITLDFLNRTVLIEDVLESGSGSEMSVGINEFMQALNNIQFRKK